MLELNEILDDIDDLNWMTDERKFIYTLIANILGEVYRQTDWSKMRSGVYATDVFEHRIKNSSHKNTIPKFINKLCGQLGIQALILLPELILKADKVSNEFLKVIRTESQLCVLIAQRYSKIKRSK